uniref:SCP domain-containing protein n=1 Tax=Clastoptera arizonana TaxID=38151 RepID=A0A1B6C4Z3_9HEMI
MGISSSKKKKSRPPYPVASLDINHIGSFTTHAHDFQNPDNIIMVRSTDQRTIAQSNGSEPPKLKTVTVSTVETYNRNQNTVRKLTTKSVDGVLESKQTVIQDIGKSHLGSQINLKSEKSKTPTFSFLSPNRSQRGTPTKQKPSQIKQVVQSTKSINKEEFAKDCLNAHNEFRTKHKVANLTLSNELSAFSQEWANYLASILTMQHRSNNKYGENLYMYMTTDPQHKVKGRDAVDSWYLNEFKKYTFGEEPSDLEAGHLTQVLWAGSEKLGVGVAKNGYYTFVVCNYDPPGNYKGEYAENVPPVGGFKDQKVALSSSKVTSVSNQDFAKDMLKLHNEYRAKHGVPPLTLNSTISDYAQAWANSLADKNVFMHRSNNMYGENLFWSSGSASAKVTCDSWYGEEANYNYNVEPFKSGASFSSGHFTQMVWKESKQLGVGRAIGKNGAYYIVANYSPRGNIINRFNSNVLQPKKGGK